MTIYLKITILARLLLFLLYINGINAQRRDMRTYLRRSDLADLTKGLSDAEIEAALSDLTLSDLDVLSKLIDTSNSVEYDYEDDGGLSNNNAKQRPFYGIMEDPSTGVGNEGNEEDEDAYDEEPIEDTGHLGPYPMPRVSMSNMRGENLRLKRENSKQTQQIPVDEDYLKQLENSFPRDQEQNDQEDIDDKKDHVRVKRD